MNLMIHWLLGDEVHAVFGGGAIVSREGELLIVTGFLLFVPSLAGEHSPASGMSEATKTQVGVPFLAPISWDIFTRRASVTAFVFSFTLRKSPPWIPISTIITEVF